MSNERLADRIVNFILVSDGEEPVASSERFCNFVYLFNSRL